MGLSPNVTLSAWNLPAVPPIVRRLEADFLRGVSEGLDSNPLLDADSRAEIGTLLGQAAPARPVGDALFMAQASGFVRRWRERFGNDSVRSAWYPAERVFQPFREARGDEGSPDGGPDGVIEASFPIEALTDHHMALAAGMVLVDIGLSPHGYHCLNPPQDDEGRMTLRFSSPTGFEAALRRLFGDAAPRLCLTAGRIRPLENNRLHKLGYAAMGFPMKFSKIHEWTGTDPLGFAVHDAGHAAYWAANVPGVMRLGACLLYEATEEALIASQKKRLKADRESLLDLIEGTSDGPVSFLKKWKAELPRRSLRHVAHGFLKRWKRACPGLGPNEELIRVLREAEAVVLHPSHSNGTEPSKHHSDRVDVATDIPSSAFALGRSFLKILS